MSDFDKLWLILNATGPLIMNIITFSFQDQYKLIYLDPNFCPESNMATADMLLYEIRSRLPFSCLTFFWGHMHEWKWCHDSKWLPTVGRWGHHVLFVCACALQKCVDSLGKWLHFIVQDMGFIAHVCVCEWALLDHVSCEPVWMVKLCSDCLAQYGQLKWSYSGFYWKCPSPKTRSHPGLSQGGDTTPIGIRAFNLEIPFTVEPIQLGST